MIFFLFFFGDESMTANNLRSVRCFVENYDSGFKKNKIYENKKYDIYADFEVQNWIWAILLKNKAFMALQICSIEGLVDCTYN